MASFTMNTKELQSLTVKASKCASNSKYNALTSLLNVVLEDGTISLTTTDSNNFFTVRKKDVSGDNLSFTVNVNLFTRLIAKMSSENIRVNVTSDMISITGNGTYKIPIQLDVDGSEIKYPKHEINNPEFSGEVKTSVLKAISQYNKPSLATTLEKPFLTRYMCVEDCVISGDEYNICRLNLNTFGTDVLISPVVIDLLCMSDEEDIDFKIYENNILFETDSMKLFAMLADGADEYPVDRIKSITTEIEYPSDCVLPKTALINAIDRLSLFIDDDDQNGLYMTFTKDGVKLESMKNSGIESVSYQGSNNFKDFTCCVGVESFRKQLVSRAGESVHIYYGDEATLTIKEGNIIQVISLQEDPRSTDEVEDNAEDENII